MPSFSQLSSFLLVLLTVFTTANARVCPAVWTKVAADLKTMVAGCSSEARQAIRATFHDCFAGACDGSLIVANEYLEREDAVQIQPVCDILGKKAEEYKVSAADLIQAAAAFGVAACGGPKIHLWVGRKDSTTPNPDGALPTQDSDAATQIAAFKKKGFTTTDLVALLGAHSAGTSLQELAFDSTPDKLDSTTFYPETVAETTPTSLTSDIAISNATATKNIWKGFGKSQASWNVAFKLAMFKMSIMGNNLATLADCSKLVS